MKIATKARRHKGTPRGISHIKPPVFFVFIFIFALDTAAQKTFSPEMSINTAAERKVPAALIKNDAEQAKIAAALTKRGAA